MIRPLTSLGHDFVYGINTLRYTDLYSLRVHDNHVMNPSRFRHECLFMFSPATQRGRQSDRGQTVAETARLKLETRQ
jgi:hypothetical protein